MHMAQSCGPVLRSQYNKRTFRVSFFFQFLTVANGLEALLQARAVDSQSVLQVARNFIYIHARETATSLATTDICCHIEVKPQQRNE